MSWRTPSAVLVYKDACFDILFYYIAMEIY